MDVTERGMVCDCPGAVPSTALHRDMTRVSRWRFVTETWRGFNGTAMFCRYRVWLVLPILDSEGRAIRHLRPVPTTRWVKSIL